MKQAIKKLIPYFDPETIVKDYTFRDGLTVTAEEPILPDAVHCIAFEYRNTRVTLRMANDGLTVLRNVVYEHSVLNMGLCSECTGWIFYDSTRGQSGDIDLDRILNDVSYRCFFVDYVMSHVNEMLQGGLK
tara:strand:+ start:746 stop:1138 length:393 start_codon:yes stop_codon:yes gene_type:complete